MNILHIMQLPKDNTIQVTFFILNVECFLSKDNENARNCVEHHSLMENSVIPSTWERQTIQISATILKMTITYLLHLSHLGNQSNLLTRWCHQDSVGNFQILHYLSLKKVRILHYILLKKVRILHYLSLKKVRILHYLSLKKSSNSSMPFTKKSLNSSVPFTKRSSNSSLHFTEKSSKFSLPSANKSSNSSLPFTKKSSDSSLTFIEKKFRILYYLFLKKNRDAART